MPSRSSLGSCLILAVAIRHQGGAKEGRKLLELGGEAFRMTVEAAREQDVQQKFLDELPKILWVYTELKDKKEEAYALYGSGMTALFDGKPDEARKLLEHSLEFNEELQNQGGIVAICSTGAPVPSTKMTSTKLTAYLVAA
jgi:hypothetical protein